MITLSEVTNFYSPQDVVLFLDMEVFLSDLFQNKEVGNIHQYIEKQRTFFLDNQVKEETFVIHNKKFQITWDTSLYFDPKEYFDVSVEGKTFVSYVYTGKYGKLLRVSPFNSDPNVIMMIKDLYKGAYLKHRDGKILYHQGRVRSFFYISDVERHFDVCLKRGESLCCLVKHDQYQP